MKRKNKKQGKRLKDELAYHSRRFDKLFPTDADCFRELWRRTYHSDIVKCRFCSTAQPKFRFEERTFKCIECQQKNSVTAGTLFENIRRPRPWLARIWFFENGITVNSNQFSQLFEIAYSTSLNIFKKITMAVVDLFPAPTDYPSSDFESVICRRSSETPANEHPKSELQSDSVDVEDQVSRLVSELEDNDSVIYEMLQPDIRMSTDQLLARSGFGTGELALSLWTLSDLGLVRRLPGDLNERVKQQSKPLINQDRERSAKVVSATEFIRDTNQGISRKYLQLYLCSFGIHSNRERWKSGALLKACCATAEITDAQVRAYVSPHDVRVA